MRPLQAGSPCSHPTDKQGPPSSSSPRLLVPVSNPGPERERSVHGVPTERDTRSLQLGTGSLSDISFSRAWIWVGRLSPCCMLGEPRGEETRGPPPVPRSSLVSFLFVALTCQTCFRWLRCRYRRSRAELEVDAAWLPWQCQLLLP